MLALAAAATALTLLLNIGAIGETMRGGFADPDDAMRLVEARNWLAGQSWFDMNAVRLDPPHGSVLHWSRLVDMPVAIMIRLFGLFTNAATAERLAAVAVPTLWLAAFYIGMMRLGRLLVGPEGRWPALVGSVLSGATLVQFAPGRIGHHAPETVALIFAVGAALAALDPRHVRQAFLSGVLIAASLAMSLETLPFLAVLAGGLALLWVWRGADTAPLIRWFGAGLLAGLPVFFLLTVGPDRWRAPVCDAFGGAHLGTGLIGAGGFLALSFMSGRLPTRLARLAAICAVAVIAVAYVVLAYPACLRSPFADVDPLVRELWLSRVVESQPLLAFMTMRPLIGTAILAPLLLGLAGSVFAFATLRGIAAQRFLLIATLSLAGLALAFLQVRVIGSITPIALCGGIYLVSRLDLRTSWKVAAILPFCSTAWLLVLPADARAPAEMKAAEAKAACLSPEAFAPLAALGPGSAVAPIDSGSHILQATKLSVFAAPYHRNNDGNRFSFEVFLAEPEAASVLLAARHVAYVITCPGSSDMQRLAKRAPEGLAARLEAGRAPPFLSKEGGSGSAAYEVYRVRAGN